MKPDKAQTALQQVYAVLILIHIISDQLHFHAQLMFNISYRLPAYITLILNSLEIKHNVGIQTVSHRFQLNFSYQQTT